MNNWQREIKRIYINNQFVSLKPGKQIEQEVEKLINFITTLLEKQNKDILSKINELSHQLPMTSFNNMNLYDKGYAQAIQDIINSIIKQQ